MQIINPGATFSFNYPTYDLASGLFVRAHVYNVTTGTPVLAGTVNMAEIVDGFYSGNYTGSFGQSYLVISLVYTDGTYSTTISDRAPNSDVYKSTDSDIEFSGFEYGAYDLDEDLFIAADVYDVSTGTGFFVDLVPMSHVLGGVYFSAFDGVEDHVYEVIKLAYTDDNYDTLNTDRSPGSDSFQLFSFGNVTIINNVMKAAELVGQSTIAILEALDD